MAAAAAPGGPRNAGGGAAAAAGPDYARELAALEDYRAFAATTVQRFWRGWVVRARARAQAAAATAAAASAASAAAERARRAAAAAAIQAAWRGFTGRREFRRARPRRAWRRSAAAPLPARRSPPCDASPRRRLCGLLRAQEAADPRALLRRVNPREAALLDPAAGLHVRLRLGRAGVAAWPPALLYKISTHRPVADICAFGPRNYAAEAAAAAAAAPADVAAAARQGRAEQARQRGTGGWYRREDRNGWRPVAERLLLGPQTQPGGAGCRSGSAQRRRRPRLCGPRLRLAGGAGGGGGDRSERPAGPCSISSISSSRQVTHHSPLVRRQERARRLKQRRRQWLLRMYRAGMADGAAPAAPGGSPGGGSPGGGERGAGCSSARAGGDGGGQGGDEALLRELEQELERQLARCGSGGGADATGAAAGCGGDGGGAGGGAGWALEELGGLGLDPELLAWSERLDYAAYVRDWEAAAVTLGSEAAAPARGAGQGAARLQALRRGPAA
ncbi:hypothetical protein HT031_006016 [Scenedesmus sp. PABB004]|nr:hypothetical protein HT031_006016 [Scenedesmus sp. PABB004]